MRSEAKTMAKFRYIGFICFIILTLLTCGGCSSSSDSNDSGSTIVPQGSDAEIGPQGGVMETSDGARIKIPAGALGNTQTIILADFMSNNDLPAGVAPIPCFRGALQLEPHGLTFSIPVTITIPVNTPMNPQEKFPLFYWNEPAQMWEQTSFVATVADDGMSFSADVTHFSLYGGGAVENLINSGDLDAFKNDFTNWFQSEEPLGKRKVKENECFEIVGYDFDLSYQINNVKDSDFWRVGRTSDYTDPPLIMVDYSYDVTKGQSFSGYVRITVTIYYDCTKPDFSLMADRSVLLEGETTSVEASLFCAGTPLHSKNITFDIASGPGEIDPGNTTTNSGGTATAKFTAGDDDSVVKAYYEACAFGDSEMVERECPIANAPDQFALSIAFDQTTSAPDFSDTYSYSGSVPIEITSDNGDGTANVSGSNTFDVTGSGAAGDCTTTLQGTVTFTFTGTLVVDDQGNQKLNLTQVPDFSTTKTIICPDDPPLTFDYLVGGETSEFTIPVENGHTIEKTINADPIISHITYVLTF